MSPKNGQLYKWGKLNNIVSILATHWLTVGEHIESML